MPKQHAGNPSSPSGGKVPMPKGPRKNYPLNPSNAAKGKPPMRKGC